MYRELDGPEIVRSTTPTPPTCALCQQPMSRTGKGHRCWSCRPRKPQAPGAVPPPPHVKLPHLAAAPVSTIPDVVAVLHACACLLEPPSVRDRQRVLDGLDGFYSQRA